MGDSVNHPDHYNSYEGLEIIDLCEQMNFNRGNAVKYITRAGLKNPATEVEDLQKAVFYLQREIGRLRGEESIIDKMIESTTRGSVTIVASPKQQFLAYKICEANMPIIKKACGKELAYDADSMDMFICSPDFTYTHYYARQIFEERYTIVKVINRALERYIVEPK